MSDELVLLIENARFTPVRGMAGYDIGEVDQLLDRLVAAVRAGEDVVPLVDGARFTRARLREAYSMSDVDELLAQVRAEAGGAPPAVPSQPDPAPQAGLDVISEQRGLLSRLFRPQG